MTPDPIADHRDGCSCLRCAGLETCPLCQRQKLDIDWCFACRRLVYLNGRFLPRPRVAPLPIDPPPTGSHA